MTFLSILLSLTLIFGFDCKAMLSGICPLQKSKYSTVKPKCHEESKDSSEKCCCHEKETLSIKEQLKNFSVIIKIGFSFESPANFQTAPYDSIATSKYLHNFHRQKFSNFPSPKTIRLLI